MFDIVTICDKIQAELNYQCVSVRNIQLAHNNQRDKQLLPIVMVNESAVLVFVQAESSERDSEKLKTRFRRVLNALTEKLDVSINSFVVCGCFSEAGANYSELCVFNVHNERINYFSCEEQLDDFLCTVIHDINFRRPAFDSAGVSHVAFNLELISGINGEVKRDVDGNYFVKKHGHWYQASDVDPDEMFEKAALFGAFGAHKFFDNKKGAGLLYFLTCGLFGVGWLLDSLSLIAGIYKDGEGKYVLPVTSRKNCFIKLLIGLGVTAAYILLYVFLLNLVGTNLGGTINNVISSNSDSVSSLTEFNTPLFRFLGP